jgi:plastocyanin
VLVGLAAVVTLGLGACSSSKSAAPAGTGGNSAPASATTTSAAVAPTTSAASSAPSSAPVGAATITISNFVFSPANLTVQPGEKVTVMNKDTTAHTVTSTPAGAFDTGDIAGGASASFTAPTKAGTYDYMCSIHQFMRGVLTVS